MDPPWEMESRPSERLNGTDARNAGNRLRPGPRAHCRETPTQQTAPTSTTPTSRTRHDGTWILLGRWRAAQASDSMEQTPETPETGSGRAPGLTADEHPPRPLPPQQRPTPPAEATTTQAPSF